MLFLLSIDWVKNYQVFKALVETKTKTKLHPEHRFHPVRRWRFDFALIDYKLAIEVEGGVWTKGRHTRPTGFIKDMEKYNAAAALGWRVLRFTPDQLLKQKTIETILQAMAVDLSGWFIFAMSRRGNQWHLITAPANFGFSTPRFLRGLFLQNYG